MSGAPGDARAALGAFPGRRVVVLGDVMLDRFIWGDVERISPEAPVPIVRVRRESARLGGAANVAANLASLGGRATVVGAVGEDHPAAEIRSHLEACGIEDGLAVVEGRDTTVKTRVIARAQQVVRVDREDDDDLGRDGREAVANRMRPFLDRADAVVVSDYAKGIATDGVLDTVLRELAERAIPVVVDPKHGPIERYAPSTLLKPNQSELAALSGLPVDTDAECVGAARALLDRGAIGAVLVTRGGRGMILVARDADPVVLPAATREVYDVTGAGDTVVAVMALGLASGADLAGTARLANLAGAVVVSKVGTATVTAAELHERSSLGGA